MTERKVLAEVSVKVKIGSKTLSEDQVLIMGRHASTLMSKALAESALCGTDEFMTVKPGEVVIKSWKFLDLKPTPEAQRKLFGESGGEEPNGE